MTGVQTPRGQRARRVFTVVRRGPAERRTVPAAFLTGKLSGRPCALRLESHLTMNNVETNP